MNINRIVKRIKRDLGIYAIALPIDNLDVLISDILTDTTLPVFSIYQPYEETFDLSGIRPERRTYAESMSDLYILPEFKGRKLLYVKGVKYCEPALYSNFNPVSAALFSGTTAFNTLATANVGKNLIDGMTNSITFHYDHPRKLYVFDALVSSSLQALLAFEHDRSFESISPTAEESFYKLAILDVKCGLYPIMKHYTELDTSLGTVNLKIDDWQAAADARQQLIQEWDESYLLDAVDLIYN
jgi:hypothetical protein